MLALAAVLSLPGTAWAESSAPKWAAHIDLEGKAGTRRNLGEADFFAPLLQNADTLLFADIRTRLDDDDSREGNFGLGIRHMLPTGWNLGAYGYFDRRRTHYDNYYNQATLGAEALGEDFDVRANIYRPFGPDRHDVDSLNTAELSGTSVIFRGGEERALAGFDGEVGWRVPLFESNAGQQLRVYGGGYRFYADGVDPVQGPRGRLDLTFDEVPYLWPGARLSLGAEVQNDGPRGTQAFASFRLRIPLQVFGGAPSSKLTAQERRMTDPVVRDIDIVAQAGAFGAAETATATAGGSSFTVVDSASTTGANLATAVTNAGANSTVILSGTFDTGATTVAMQAGQSLLGGGVAVRSPSGRVATLTTRATVNMNGTVNGINMANNSTLSGLTVTATHTAGVFPINAQGRSNVTITNNTITATDGGGGAVALDLLSSTNAVVRGNTITARGNSHGGNGVRANGATGLTFAGNSVDAVGTPSNAFVGSNTTTLTSSTGNILVNGVCFGTPYGSGSVSFTNGTVCQ